MEQTLDVKPSRIPSHACLTCRKSVVKVKAGASVLESTRRVSSALNTGTGSVARIWAAWLPVIRSGKHVLINIELPQTYSLASYFYRRARSGIRYQARQYICTSHQRRKLFSFL